MLLTTSSGKRWEGRIAASFDDTETRAGFGQAIVETELFLGSIDESIYTDVGLRFVNVTIPNAATIVRAVVQFTASQAHSDATTVSIKARAHDNAPQWDSSTEINTHPQTAGVSWTPASWLAIGDAGDAQRTIDIAAPIQTTVNRAGWASGNALALIISRTFGVGRRVAHSWDGSPSQAPLLSIKYTV